MTYTTPIATGHEGSVRDQFRAYLQRLRGGEMGALPAMLALVVLGILFSSLSPYFLTTGNIANLFVQASALMVIAFALVFVLLLAEIDLSAGVTGGSGMAVFQVLNGNLGWNWIVSLILALAMGAFIGAFVGFFVSRIGVPSFVVTLGLFIALQGFMLLLPFGE